MKVYIGKYQNHYSVYSYFDKYIAWRHEKPHYVVDDKDYTKFERFLESVCDKLQVVLNLTINKLVRNRKIKVRIDAHDTYNLDHTLALIIIPALKQLKGTKHGTPCINDEDMPENLKSLSEEHRWDYVLDEMIWAFEQIADENSDDQFHTGIVDYNFEELPDGNSKMIEGPEHTHKFDREAFALWNDRINNGTTLFGKYYRSLWD